MAGIGVVIRGEAQPGKRDEVLALYQKHLAPRAEANPSQNLVIWCADNSDENTFFLLEHYTDEAAMQANSGAEWFAAYMQEAGPLLAGMPDMFSGESRYSTGLT